MSDQLTKRTWVYVQRPKEYEIAFHGCGHTDPDWSEYEKHLWCPVCLVDFIPESGGVFDGPIGIECCRMLGIVFDRFNLETQQVEKFEDWGASRGSMSDQKFHIGQVVKHRIEGGFYMKILKHNTYGYYKHAYDCLEQGKVVAYQEASLRSLTKREAGR